MKKSTVIWSGTRWNVVPLACGYLWRLVSQTDSRKMVTVNYDELIRIQHGK